MSADPDSDDDGYSCMELPTLIKQLRSVLDQYPDDGQILKELIQNAEDAEASEVKILYDGRQIDPQIDPRLLKKRKYLLSLQAPALCVYNNALFTEKDWKGIKMLHNSIKEEEPLKVGRFGLGFKSVFHVTDFPCIVSGDSVLFLNPHDRNSDRVCYMKKLVNLDNDTRQILGKVIDGTFGFTSASSSYPGTLFWFPLRTKKSELSDNLYTDKKAMDLFEAFKAEAPRTLLFLKFIERIQLYTTSLERVFLVQLSEKCLQAVRADKEAFINKVKELNGRIPPSSIQNRLFLDVEMHDFKMCINEHQEWLVINLYKGGHISDKLRGLNSDPSLSYCPYVGLAVPLGKPCLGHVFCFLPLPLENRSPTGLPVHVNGFFALSQNRRHVKWPTADQVENEAHMDKAIQWNTCLVSEVLPDVYCSILKEVIQFCKNKSSKIEDIQQQVYSLIRPKTDLEVNWRPLMSNLLKQILSVAFLFTPNRGGMWIQLQDSIVMDDADESRSIILDVFTMYHENIVPLPSLLLSTLRDVHGSYIKEVSREKMSLILKSDNMYTSLPREKKLALLRYLKDYKYLVNLQLLPVDDGKFVHFGDVETIYFCVQPDEIQIFPGVENRFVSRDLPSDLETILKGLATEGVNSMALMSRDVFPHLLQICLSQHFPEGNADLRSSSLTLSWLRQVWKYISQYGIDVRRTLNNLQILPEIDEFGSGSLHSMKHIFIAQSMPNMESLPQRVCNALRKLDIITLPYIPDFVLNATNVMGEVIQYSTPAGVMRTLDLLTERNMTSATSRFNSESTKEERHALVDYMNNISHISSGTKIVLKELQVFLDTNNRYCDVGTLNILAPNEDLPAGLPYPETYILNSKSTRLVLSLGAHQMRFEDLCLKILKMMNDGRHCYTQNQVLLFMDFLMKKHQQYLHRQEIKAAASRIKFLTSSGGRTCLRASDLFDSDPSRLKTLFLGEDRFPASSHVQTSYMRTGLKLIGLKTENDISESDILTSAQQTEEMARSGKVADTDQKVTSLLYFLDTHSFDALSLCNLKDYQCIPIIKGRPKRYPDTLPWKGESSSNFLSSSQLYSSKHAYIIGSVSPVAVQASDKVEQILSLKKTPPAHLVIDHLINVSKCYQSKEHHIYTTILHQIYTFLSTVSVFSDWEKDRIQGTKSIWIEDDFQYPKSVYIDRSDVDLDLKPYRFQLPQAMQQWKSFLLSFGCHYKQTSDMLATVLLEIKEKHDKLKASDEKSPLHVQQDMKLILQILGVLKTLQERPGNLYLPTHQEHNDFLVLQPLNQCTYCNADWLKDQTSEDTKDQGDIIMFVHADISENTAQQLGVSSLTDRVMDDTDDLNMDYHQSEPLTNRLKYLLREYTDGFSVPKELIQNADDAGATEVCFMYDERENRNARKFLMHDGMEALQGPAFWAYNNASFQESDFTNITKLSGATKEEDTTKVGKFGLGFNSVYNLTDVPSFISDNTIVIFDPHGKHLGRQGLKANLKSVKNQLMLKKMYGQFKPFEGVFGCQFKSEKICPGTLFRLPLRTQQQASDSDIKNLSYSKSEMENFYQVFVEGCGSLVLFTQHVKSVKFYHLSQDGDPMAPQLLVHVKKDILSRRVISPTVLELTSHDILSFADQEWEKHAKNETSIKIQERSLINRNILADMTRNQTIGSATVPWNITWVTGSKESATFAMSKKLKGLLPLAAVAVALKLHNTNYSALYLDKCPQGFYKEGHLFCFLPLPLKVPFPVHINATFALTPDRRQLCTKTEDDKMLLEAEWNDALMKDAVSRAYVSALSELEVNFSSDIDVFYHIWPVGNDQLVRGFYGKVIQEDEKIFVIPSGQGVKRSTFQSIRYLDPQLYTDKDIGEIAFKAAKHFWHYDPECLIQLPKGVLDSFKATGFETEIMSRCMSKLEFFESIFFPNIADPYWSSEDRDKLTLYALKSTDANIHMLIKHTSCIPTHPSGTLKRPSELVHPHGQCAGMFVEEDECFPKEGFGMQTMLELLENLGMVKHDLPGESLLARANSVSDLLPKSEKQAFRRCREIIQYISFVEYSSKSLCRNQRYSQYPDSVKAQMKEIPFFPILQCPVTWPKPLIWKADELDGKRLARANDLFDDGLISLVACSELVIDKTEFRHSSNVDNVLLELGLKEKNKVEIHTVTRQLCLVAKLIESSDDLKILGECSRLCNKIYGHLNCHCQEGPAEAIARNKEIIQQTLGRECIILTGQKMVYPRQVAFSLSHDLSPHLYQAEKIHEQFRSLFITLGIKQTFDMHDVLDVMKDIAKSTGLQKISKMNLTCFGRLASCLLELLPETSCQEDVYEIQLPDENGHFHEAYSLCLNDCDEVEDDVNTMKFIHPDIHQRVAKWFGVKGKREADLSEHISVTPYLSSFGQIEKLTTRIKRILSGYPCDASIMKELLQNADDADATQLMFIKDFRSLPSKQIFSENWESLQGPALCVYNNSYFSEKDFTGIQNLGEGSKGDDPVKTGQYGVGFNAVYHLTDVPTFMTIGPNTEKTICAFDPQVKYVPRATSKAPGVRISKLETLRGKYKDAFSGYLEDCVPLQQQGTLFRFPLRTESMAEESSISQKEVTTDAVSELLEEFKSEMFDSLLFLHCVKKITVAHVSEDGQLIEEYWVQSTMSDSETSKQKGFLSHLRTQAENVKDQTTGIGIRDVSPLEIQLSVFIEDSESKQQKWLVIHHSGFAQGKDLPESLVLSWERGDIGLLPRGGVAVPVPSKSAELGSAFQGKAFCILPLPIVTGLPVHINGHFALDHEARRNLWHSSSDYRSDWNKHTVEAVIIPAYISALQALKIELECTKQMNIDMLKKQLAKYYFFFPEAKNATDIFWKSVISGFYSELLNRKSAMFSVIKPAKGKFSDYPKDRTESIEGKVVWVPVSVQKGFPGYFNYLKTYFPVEKSDFETPYVTPAQQFDRYSAALKEASRNMRILNEVLRDLGMKVIEAPEKICDNFRESVKDDTIGDVTPMVVLKFLKSHSDDYHDTCKIGILPRKVNETPLKSLATVKLLTSFIAKANTFASDLCNLPLAVTDSEIVRTFCSSDPIIVTRYNELLKAIPNVVLHRNLTKFYLEHAVQLPSLRPLTLQTFTELLPQLLDQDTFGKGTLVLWKNKENPSKSWIVCLWKYLEEELSKLTPEMNRKWVRQQLQSIESWCIVPAKSGSSQDQSFLYPLTQTAKLLDFESVNDKNIRDSLEKLNVPQLDQSEQRSSKIAPFLVASWDRPGSVLFVLSEMVLSGIEKVRESEADRFLYHFCSNLRQLASDCGNPRDRLKKLPFYPTLAGKLVSVNNAYAVSHSSLLPKDGLKEWSEQTGITLIKFNVTLKHLYEYIGLDIYTPTEVYSALLIPQFNCIPSQFKATHIEFIRDRLLMKTENYSSEQEALIQQMKVLQFIETSDGTLHRACDFYSNKEVVFTSMLPPSAFPPQPYNQKEWYNFLTLIGLQTEVTIAHFVTLAKEIERLGSNGISNDVACKSKVLTSHLRYRPNKVKEGILYQIRDIRFLLPYIVEKEHSNGRVLIQIHPQMQKAKFLVCYSESVSPHHCFCAWTSSTMYGKSSDLSETERGKNLESAYSQLGISKYPSPETVIQHVQNICASIIRMHKQIPIQNENLIKILKEVMTAVYEYFQQNGVSDTIKQRLCETSMIFLPDERIMVAATQVVTRLSKDEVIEGYIFSGPLYFGKYFPIFHKLGASESASSKHFAMVLNNLSAKVGKMEMNPNELKIAQKAMKIMFDYLRKEAKSKRQAVTDMCSLFLPSKDKTMILSKELVLSDNKCLESRVESLKLNYFVGFSSMAMDEVNPLNTISLLPESHRPLILTHIVKETLSQSSRQKSRKGILSHELSEVLEAPEFISGVIRLINDARCSKSKEPLNKTDCEKIENDILKIKVLEVENLQTVLSHKDCIVAGSEEKRRIITEENENEVCIYISTDVCSRLDDSICIKLSFAIDKLTGFQLGGNTSCISSILKAAPAEIGVILDSLQVMAFEYFCSLFSKSVFPPPGTIIPEKFHFMLDNSFGYFTPGEYAGYEVYDSFIDEDVASDAQFKEGIFVVYVKIRQVVTQGDSPLLGRYIIEGKDGSTEEVSATQLYKFIREKENVCTELEVSNTPLDSDIHGSMDMKAVLTEIRKTLKDAWAVLGEKDRNRVKKRLYLKWHPDKNPDRKEFCNEVCKYIALYVQRLEKGLDIDDIDDDVYQGRSSTPDYSWFYHFDARSRRQREYQDECRQQHNSSRHSFPSGFGFGFGFGFGQSCHRSARCDSHPNHLEAERWFRQAKADLFAATEVLGLSQAYNWICFKCQQAAEKAVKAMWYCRDAGYADGIRSHDISSIASRLGDPVLTNLVSLLQGVIQDFERLRYPDRLSYPRIPADVYTDADARQACELAKKVIEHVQGQLN